MIKAFRQVEVTRRILVVMKAGVFTYMYPIHRRSGRKMPWQNVN